MILVILAYLLSAVVAAIHVYIFYLEAFLWRRAGPKVFKFTKEYAATTAVLASNQGLYNFLLAGGLLWGLLERSLPTLFFFNTAIVGAAIFGALTVTPRIMISQGSPAIVASIVVALASDTLSLPSIGIAVIILAVSAGSGFVIAQREKDLAANPQ